MKYTACYFEERNPPFIDKYFPLSPAIYSFVPINGYLCNNFFYVFSSFPARFSVWPLRRKTAPSNGWQNAGSR